MCGIAGIFLKKSPLIGKEFEKALNHLSNRGPDGQGIYLDGSIGLGHTRLSVIDLSSGHQPMANEDESLWITYNGEVYNYRELRDRLIRKGHDFKTRSDTETILHLYEEYGFDCVKLLRGMFAFAIWDEKGKTLFLARDRIGVKPLVYAQSSEGFFLASEINALFSLNPSLSREVDFVALDHYLTFQYIPSPMTGFKAIKKLSPAHFMVVKHGKIERIERYWDIDFSKKLHLSFGDACDALREKFIEATKIRLISDVPLGAFLSGGVDSSLTVAAMSRLMDSPVKTFSIGFEEEGYNELPYARKVADLYSTKHNEMIVKPKAIEILPMLIDHFGEPMADNSTVPTYYVSKFARESVKVVLTGDGGDESFAGYTRFHQASFVEEIEKRGLLPFWRSLKRATSCVDKFLHPGKSRPFPAIVEDKILFLRGMARYRRLLAYFKEGDKDCFYTSFFKKMAEASDTEGYLKSKYDRAKETTILNRYLYVDLTTYLPEGVLYKVDICSMMNSLESRSPFLDHELIELAFMLPDKFKLKFPGKFPQRHKHIVKEAFSNWFPDGFLYREKMGFTLPVRHWLEDKLYDYTRESLLTSKRLHKLIKRDAIEKILQEHKTKLHSYDKELWSLLILSCWMEKMEVEI